MKLNDIIGGSQSLHRRLALLILGGNLLLGILLGTGHLWNLHVAGETLHARQLAHLAQESATLFHPLSELVDATHQALAGTLSGTQYRALLADHARKLGALKTRMEQLKTSRQYHADNRVDGISGRYLDFEQASTQIIRAGQLIADALQANEMLRAQELFTAHFLPARETLSTGILALSEEVTGIADRDSLYVMEHFETARRIMILLVLLLIPISILFGIAAVNRIVKPLRELSENMRSMVSGEGDLATRLPEGKGEVGEMAELYNRLVDKIRHVIEQVIITEAHLQQSSQRLLANAEQTRLGLSGQESEVEDTITKMQGLSEDIVAVGQHAGQAREATEDAQERSAAGRKAMQNAMNVMRQLDEKSTTAAQVMEQLAASVSGIGMAVEVINKLSDQTNLLALNAAIEAARAGESGRGFAVVADEVRNLAASTRDSTGQISAIADEVRRQVDASREAMDINRRYVSEALEQVEGVAITLSEIDAASQRIASMSRQIADAVDRQNETAEDIGRNSINLRMTTRQAESNAIAMESLSHDLDLLVQKLYAIIGAFNMTDECRTGLEIESSAAVKPASGDVELF